MLNALKRLLGGSGSSIDWPAIEAWARNLDCQMRRERDPFKVVFDGHFEPAERWRLEYGTTQRGYIDGNELRMRMELQLPPSLNVLLLSRTLKEKLESQAYERFTKAMTTQIDINSPEEMRWLAMYPKVALREPEGMRSRYGMVANAPNAAASWLEGRLGTRLLEFGAGTEGAAFVLMTLRGRLYLRLGTPTLSVHLLEEVLGLFRLAATRARETLAQWAEDDDGSWVSTTSHAWAADSHIELPVDPAPDEGGKRR
jgi:hypothetical protein